MAREDSLNDRILLWSVVQHHFMDYTQAVPVGFSTCEGGKVDVVDWSSRETG